MALTTKIDENDEKKEIVLLFVAHDGIQQEALWREWLDLDGSAVKSKIGIAVQANSFLELTSGHLFVEENRTDVKRFTSWGDLEVPLSIQKSLRSILDRFVNAERIYVISG